MIADSSPSRATFVRALLLSSIVMSALALALAPSASGHPERTTFFPDHTKGEVPTYRSSGGNVLTVCRPDSAARIADIYADAADASTREALLARAAACRIREIQAAVDRARTGDRIQILPGVYTEPTSRAVAFNSRRCPMENAKYWEPTNDGHGENGMVPTYQFHWDCKNSRNLIQILGDSPKDKDRECDQRCDLQLEGMGKTPEDVVVVGDRTKRDVIRADRADGVVIKNLTAEQGSFNGVNAVETNGFLLDHVVGRYNQNYGILTFTSDNGLYDFTEGYRNGDSGLYPGSGPEGHCLRYGIEIRNSSSHDNVLGQSGTAGNGTWIHDSKWFDNGTGIVNDSFASGHPGMPQDCSKWERNEVYSNNTNYFERDNQAYCAETPFEQRPRDHVCPQFQSPVGVGFAMYGVNDNIYRENRIWDNWRSGYRQFWVPGSVRGDTSPEAQRDTSHGNRITNNVFGLAPDGSVLRNGVDVYWDEQGDRNCWEDNQGADGQVTSDPATLPTCASGGSSGAVSNPEKLARETSCATWDPADNPFPPGCEWFTTPPKPE